jgi:hypothetical protein
VPSFYLHDLLFANIAEMHISMNSNSRHLECSTRLIWFGDSLTYDPICENEYNNFSQSLPMNKEHKMCMNNQICFTSSGEPLVISLGKSICLLDIFVTEIYSS